MSKAITQAEVSAAISSIKALADAIKDLGEVPAGHLYAGVMGVMSLVNFDKAIGILVRGGIITRSGDLLKWNL